MWCCNTSTAQLQPQCASNNGGCQQICKDVNGAAECSCYSGYVLDTDGSSCIGKYVVKQHAILITVLRNDNASTNLFWRVW